MGTLYIQQGAVADWGNSTGAAVSSDAVVRLGLYGMGIAGTDIANADTGSVQLEGVFRLAKNGDAFTQGGKVWWDGTQCRATPAKNAYFIGFAFRAAATEATTLDVRLDDFCCEGPRLLTLAATGAETLNVGDFAGGSLTLLVPNTAAKTVNLPAVATIPIGARLRVRKTDATAAAITLDPNGSEQINGGSTFASLDANNDYAEFANSGTAWVLVDSAIA